MPYTVGEEKHHGEDDRITPPLLTIPLITVPGPLRTGDHLAPLLTIPRITVPGPLRTRPCDLISTLLLREVK